ncbi:MAG: YihY/virulence factor BrkB family protein [Chitinophagaceae bacterium]|nr:MAG: YihY/virulence factor BrkB family protein [Chitinophagaceae bacterium]
MNQLGNYLSDRKWIKQLISWSKRVVLPGFDGLPLYDVMVFFFKEAFKGQLTNQAAAISFFFLLAMPPTCIFLFTLLPYIPLSNLEHTIYILAREITPNHRTFQIVKGIIHDFLHTQRTGLLSLAFLLAIFYSSTAVLGILRSFNKNHPVFRRRNVFQQRWTAIKINCLLILLVIVSIILMVAQSSVFRSILHHFNLTNEAVRLFIGLARWLIIILLFFTVISLIYTYGPAVKKRWRFITAGSTLATFLTILSTLGFSFYVNHFSRYNKIYGSIGSLIVLMVWIYINSFVLLIGFELNASIEMIRQEAEARIEKEDIEEGDWSGLT